jgi:sporulation protein YlmC with PRC-barrel domain
MDASKLKGMAVVSLAEGTKLGTVARPLIDLAALRLVALQVKGDSGTFVIPFEQVRQVGTDAITVASSQVTQIPGTDSAATALLDLDQIGKLKVVDQAGTLLGTVAQLTIDAASGQISHLGAHKGGMLGMGGTTTPIPAQAILSVGPDLLTVDMGAAQTPAS